MYTHTHTPFPLSCTATTPPTASFCATSAATPTRASTRSSAQQSTSRYYNSPSSAWLRRAWASRRASTSRSRRAVCRSSSRTILSPTPLSIRRSKSSFPMSDSRSDWNSRTSRPFPPFCALSRSSAGANCAPTSHAFGRGFFGYSQTMRRPGCRGPRPR